MRHEHKTEEGGLAEMKSLHRHTLISHQLENIRQAAGFINGVGRCTAEHNGGTRKRVAQAQATEVSLQLHKYYWH